MADHIYSPVSDRCVHEGCNRPRSEHRQLGMHTFVGPEQLPRRTPVDPLKTVRKMTAEEKESAVTGERIFVAPSATARPAGKVVPPAEASVEPSATEKLRRMAIAVDPTLCHVITAGTMCGRPKPNHRGSIGHTFNNLPRRNQAKTSGAKSQVVMTSQVAMMRAEKGAVTARLPIKRDSKPTLGQVTAAIEAALRSVDVPGRERTRIRALTLDPNFSIDGDATLLSIEVTAKVSLLFASEVEA